MKLKRSRRLRPNEKIPGGNFAKAVIDFAIAVTGKGDERRRLTREEKRAQEVEAYRRLRVNQAKARRAVQRQCKELLQHYQGKMR